VTTSILCRRGAACEYRDYGAVSIPAASQPLARAHSSGLYSLALVTSMETD